jgi:hypothetical protein
MSKMVQLCQRVDYLLKYARSSVGLQLQFYSIHINPDEMGNIG